MGDDDGGLNVREENPYLPDLAPGPKLSHYYGDYVRQIFMASAAVMLILSPFLARALPEALPFEIGGALVIAILGALTNPMRQISMLANAIASAVGVVVYELLALNAFHNGAMVTFIAREALAIAFLFALYFSLKTLRNMALGMVGKGHKYGDFVEGE